MTTSILRIDTSARRSGSISRDLTDRIIARFPDAGIATRDLADGLPLLDEAWVGANFTPEDQRSDEQRKTLALSDALIAEIETADTLVIGLPIYNFGVPAALKAWVDLIARAGRTFHYTETGPEGLLKGKRAIIAFASGGVPVGSPMDYATSYIKQALAFVGIDEVQIVSAAGVAMDADAAVKTAVEQIEALDLAA